MCTVIDVSEPSNNIVRDHLMVCMISPGGLKLEYVLFEEFVLSAGSRLLYSDNDFIVLQVVVQL